MEKAKFLERCDKVMAFSYYALIYFLPISTALIETFAGLAQVTYFIKRGALFKFNLKEKKERGERLSFFQVFVLFLKSFKPVSSYLSKPIGIFIFVNFLSLLFSQFPTTSLKSFFFNLLQSCFSYFIFIECINNHKRIKTFLIAFYCSILLVSVNGISQLMLGVGFIRGRNLELDGRVASSFKHPNDFGSYLIIVVTILLALLILFVFSRKKENADVNHKLSRSMDVWYMHLGTVVLFVLSFVNLGVSYSRGAWLGFLAALLFLAFKNIKRSWMPVAIGVIFILVFLPLMMKARNVSFISDDIASDKSNHVELVKDITVPPEGLFNKLKSIDLEYSDESFSGNGRIGFWIKSLKIVRDYPVLGAGLGVFSDIAPSYRIEAGGSAHNCFIHMAAEIGVVGVLAFFWILFVFFVNSARINQKLQDRFSLAMSSGIQCGLIGFFVHCTLDTSLYSIQLDALMWAMMALLVTIQKVSLQEKIVL